jgi:hypothetical protein
MGKEYKTTKKDFELFEKECRKWIDFFGLLSFELAFDHRINNENLAGVEWDIVNCWCDFYLCKNWGRTKPTKSEIEKTAFHEVFHLLLAKLKSYIVSRSFNIDEVEAEFHKIIRIMENKVYPLIK